MSNPGSGGRSRKAPYDTIHYRIPEPIKPTVERFAAAYRILAGTKNWNECDRLSERVDSAIAATGQEDSHQSTIHEAIIENLQTELKKAQEQIEELQVTKKTIAAMLLPTIGFLPQQGKKFKGVIQQVLTELSQE